MSSQALSLPSFFPSSSFSSIRPQLFPGFWYEPQGQRVSFNLRPRCNGLSCTDTTEYVDGGVINRRGDDTEEQITKVTTWKEIMTRVQRIKRILKSMEDGEISISAYDTAWVGLIKDVNGSEEPQFPKALEWISNNQSPDGSWGDALFFNAYDRLLNTLACVVALKSWNLHPDKIAKGLKFFKDNLNKTEDETEAHVPAGFEVVFPSLLELARKLDIEVPDEDSPVLQHIYEWRNLKLKQIPKDIMHKTPTPLLYSLEGMSDLEWDKLLKLQFEDGSFFFSPSSTAYAFMQTKDDKCLTFLYKVVQKFNGGVPNFYPVDLYEHTWATDRLERLGISRFFQQELKECMNYVARYWTESGMYATRNSKIYDIDDTSMGFRMLRLYGHNVSSDVFKQFKNGDKFECVLGKTSPAVTGMYSFFKASQVLFPGETILEEAREFSYNFLREKQATNDLSDKWLIAKDLPGEVSYALDVPWFASLPRVEARFYIEQYGGEDDVWIAKVLYRMPNVSNNEYLELAKLDYNTCQSLHRVEWVEFQRWYEECNMAVFGVSKSEVLSAYYVCASSIFEPERAKERIAWAKTSVLLLAIDSYFNNKSIEERKDFLQQFKYGVSTPSLTTETERKSVDKTKQKLVEILHGTLNDLSSEAVKAHGANISHILHREWKKWLINWVKEGDVHQRKAELILKTIDLTKRCSVSDEFMNYSFKYQSFFQLANRVCHQLAHFSNNKILDKYNRTTPEIESDMQELAQMVFQKSSDTVKQTFFTVVKSFYYTAIFDPQTIKYHMSKVLFERVY